MVQSGIVHLSRFINGFIQMFLVDVVLFTFHFEPGQDFLQYLREEFFHLTTRRFPTEWIALVQTLPGGSKKIPKAVVRIILFNDVDRAKSGHVITGNGNHCPKLCLVTFLGRESEQTFNSAGLRRSWTVQFL